MLMLLSDTVNSFVFIWYPPTKALRALCFRQLSYKPDTRFVGEFYSKGNQGVS